MTIYSFSVDNMVCEITSDDVDQEAQNHRYLKIVKTAEVAINGVSKANWVTVSLLERFIRWLFSCVLSSTVEKCKSCSAKALKQAAAIAKGKSKTLSLTEILEIAKKFSKIDFSSIEGTDKLTSSSERLDISQLTKLLEEESSLRSSKVVDSEMTVYDYILSVHKGGISHSDAKSNRVFIRDMRFVIYKISQESIESERQNKLLELVKDLHGSSAQIKSSISARAVKYGKQSGFEETVKEWIEEELKQPISAPDLILSFIVAINDQCSQERRAAMNTELMEWSNNHDLYDSILHKSGTTYPKYFPDRNDEQDSECMAYISEKTAIEILTKLGYISKV